MKHTRTAALLFGLLILLAAPRLWAQTRYTPESVPDPKRGSGSGYISDPANLLDAADKASINQVLASLERSSTAQVAVVVLPSIGEAVPREFVYELFNRWGIGQAGKDNGLMLLVVMDQRRSEIETGYGLEGLLPDVICYRILLEELVPRFQAGDYGEGVLATVQRVKELLEDPAALEELRRDMEPTVHRIMGQEIPPPLYYYGWVAALVSIGLLAWVLLTLNSKDELYDKYRHIKYVTGWFWMLVFPVPYLLVYPALKMLLRHLRHKPRFGPRTGKLLHLLSEYDEDAHLEQGQIVEEEVRSVDYDVWVSDDCDEVLVLPYAKLMSGYSACEKCGYKTYHLEESRTLKYATRSSSGLELHIHHCKNCNFRKEEQKIIPRIQNTSSGGSSGGGGGGGGSWGGGSSGGGGAGASW